MKNQLTPDQQREQCRKIFCEDAARYPKLAKEYRYQVRTTEGKVLHSDCTGKLFEMYLEAETGIVERGWRDGNN